jgi:hypothetical protein
MKKERGDFVLECGARIRDVYDPEQNGSDIDQLGRTRICVFDSHGKPSMRRPTLDDGAVANCMYGCPCKRRAGRKHSFGFPPDYEDRVANGEKIGEHGFHWQRWVTCYGRWKEGGQP